MALQKVFPESRTQMCVLNYSFEQLLNSDGIHFMCRSSCRSTSLASILFFFPHSLSLFFSPSCILFITFCSTPCPTSALLFVSPFRPRGKVILPSTTSILQEDNNRGAILIKKNQQIGTRTKHIDIS